MQDMPVSNPSRKKTLKSETTASDPKLCIVTRQHIQISYAQKAARTKQIIVTKCFNNGVQLERQSVTALC